MSHAYNKGFFYMLFVFVLQFHEHTFNYISHVQHLSIHLCNDNGPYPYYILYLQHINLQTLFKKDITSLHFYMIFEFSFVNNYIFVFYEIIYLTTCSLKDSQIFLAQSLPLYTSCLSLMLSNNDIVDIEKSAIVVDKFPAFFYSIDRFC